MGLPLKIGTDSFVQESVSEAEEPFVVLDYPHKRMVAKYLRVSSRNGDELFICVDSNRIRQFFLDFRYWHRDNLAITLETGTLSDMETDNLHLYIDGVYVRLCSLAIRVNSYDGWKRHWRLGFPIDETLLKMICSANKLEIHFSFSNSKYSHSGQSRLDLPIENENLGNGTSKGFILFSQCFYNAITSTNEYPSAVIDYSLYENNRNEVVEQRRKTKEKKHLKKKERAHATIHKSDGPTPLGWAIIVFIIALIVLFFFIIFGGLEFL